jgi:hypothetical protein
MAAKEATATNTAGVDFVLTIVLFFRYLDRASPVGPPKRQGMVGRLEGGAASYMSH